MQIAKVLFYFLRVPVFASIPIVFYQPPEPPKVFEETDYYLGWDINFSPYSGGEDILFATRAVERIEGLSLAKTPAYYSTSAPARFWRFTELFLGWMPANFLGVVIQHEVFGHGYRIRDINHGVISVHSYEFDTPFPYGTGGGATFYSYSDQLSTTQETAVCMAGVESTAILAQQTKLKWLSSSKIDPRQVVLYLLSQHDLNLYIGSLETQGDLEGHDIQTYIHSLNWTYTNDTISGGRLRSLSWINLADPFTYFSIYSWFRYLLSGKESSIPMIRLGSYRYLPGIRLGLTPFGPEFFMENYLVHQNRPYYFYGKGGSHSQNTYLGIGFYAPTVFQWGPWMIGLRFDAWRQPKLLLSPGNQLITEINLNTSPDPLNPLYSYSEQHSMRLGAAGSVIVAVKPWNRVGFEAEGGYKSQGFLPGNALKAAPIARLFCSLFF